MRCLVPKCTGEAGEFGVCIGHLADYRRGDADVKKAMDRYKRERAASGEPHVPEAIHQRPTTRTGKKEGPEEPRSGEPRSMDRCRVPGCERPAHQRGICKPCQVYANNHKHDTSPENLKLVARIEAAKLPSQSGKGGHRGKLKEEPVQAPADGREGSEETRALEARIATLEERVERVEKNPIYQFAKLAAEAARGHRNG